MAGAPENVENLPAAKIRRSVSTRSLEPLRTPTLLQPRATQKQVAAAYGITYDEMRAAAARSDRSDTKSGHDGRQLGTTTEQELMAAYAKTCGVNRIAQTRRDLAIMLRDFLESRKKLIDEGKPAQPLNHREEAYLRNDNGRGQPSDEFWHYFEANYQLTIAEGREQELSRSVYYTQEACDTHFRKLNKTLHNMGFIAPAGRYHGEIVRERECGDGGGQPKSWFSHAAGPRSPSMLAIPRLPLITLLPQIFPGLADIFTMDEVPGLKAGPKFRGYVTEGTTDGAARPGVEHNQRATVVMTVNMCGMTTMPHIITANKTPNVIIPDQLAGKPLLWYSTPNGYIDAKFMEVYAKRLRQTVGHSRPLLLIMDGCRAHVTVPVLATFSRLCIRVFILPPHTSHGLAPLDQFFFKLHYCRVLHEHRIFQGGLIYNNYTNRLTALGLATVECCHMPDLVVNAWRRAGITKEQQSTTLLANVPRPVEASSSAAAAPAAAAAMPACMAVTSADASKEELLLQMEQMRQLIRQLSAAPRTQYPEIAAAEEAAVSAKLGSSVGQLTAHSKARTSVRPSPMGDVTDADFQKALIESHARRQEAQAKTAKREALKSFEEPVINRLISDGVIEAAGAATVVVLKGHLKNLSLPTSGSRKALIQRLADHYELQLVELEADDAVAASAAPAAEAEADDTAVSDDEEVPTLEEQPYTGDQAQVSAEALATAAEEVAAMSAPDHTAIAELLAGREDFLKIYWEQQEAEAKTAARRAKRESKGSGV